ncbi:mRNA cap guaninemethyltransferase [Blastocystis sp. subtype 4]|uniref:mRNA cap guaninemethyltransferase n=1 Tax=Blastocystis sp. subtype 4 TaxID=944170 RepID=UPI000711FE4E|nr:mRNA cap guaninemethyltransferase [Blastocystis sp. subtype 4]KNB45311.1 mRNA cap guaninemethyltransferase [Blastocystis sp. subtype 4]|eukprot:XP_014528754.1 mRNA cap guaninemethyltransferase [Blastocystis sp. subtype 4]
MVLPEEEGFSSLGDGFGLKRSGPEAGFSKVSSDVNEVALHYSKRQDVSEEVRSSSRILHLRNLNNWIKFTLIHEYGPLQGRVLDLACGKGGDLKKWKEQHPSEYVGVDIAEGSIHDAVRRFKEIRGVNFPARFGVANLGTCDLSGWLDPSERFDVVSCQFAMHYMFEKESMLRCFFKNVSHFLKVGGYFIATIADCDSVCRLLRSLSYHHNGEYVWRVENEERNGICCIAMKDQNWERMDDLICDPFGIEYKFTLAESVDDVSESLAPTALINQLCEEYHLKLEKKVNFLEYIREMLPKFEEEYVRMNVPNVEGGLTKDEVEAAQIYCVLVLRRIAGEEEEEEEGLNDPLGKLPQEISEADIVNLLRSRLCYKHNTRLQWF